MNVFLEYLKRHVPITDKEAAIILSKIKHRKYLKGQYLVQSGDICKFQNYIVSGKVRTFYLDHKGNEHIVQFGIENWWAAGLGSFISQTPADFEQFDL